MNTEILETFAIFFSALVVLVGYLWNEHSKRKEEKRIFKIERMVKAFEILSRNRPCANIEYGSPEIQNATNEINIYGSEEEINAFNKLLTTIAKAQEGNLKQAQDEWHKLLNLLRDDIRKEYGFKKPKCGTIVMFDKN